ASRVHHRNTWLGGFSEVLLTPGRRPVQMLRVAAQHSWGRTANAHSVARGAPWCSLVCRVCGPCRCRGPYHIRTQQRESHANRFPLSFARPLRYIEDVLALTAD